MGHRAAIYCRVSTADQSCERQEFDLRAFAGRAGYDVVGIFKETGSGTKLDRAERKKVLALAQSRQIDAILVTELSRWGRSTLDLLNTLRELENWKVYASASIRAYTVVMNCCQNSKRSAGICARFPALRAFTNAFACATICGSNIMD